MFFLLSSMKLKDSSRKTPRLILCYMFFVTVKPFIVYEAIFRTSFSNTRTHIRKIMQLIDIFYIQGH